MKIKWSVFFIFFLVSLHFQALTADDISFEGLESVAINTDNTSADGLCPSDIYCVIKSHIIEVSALGAVVLFLLLFFIFKKSKTTTQEIAQDTLHPTNDVKLATKADNLEVSSPEPTLKEKDSQKLQEKTSSTKRKKREVPSHAKITKDDFTIFSGVRILIAEDNIINQKVISGLLADSGMEYIIANDGVEALEILQDDNNFSLVLMDVHMPKMNGFEATKLIRENPNYEHIAVIALSGDTATDDIKKMMHSGMEEYLEKPLRMDALYDILYSYTDDSSKTGSVNTNELNTEDGLSICGGDKEFYTEILNEFVQSYSDAPQRITQMLKNNKLEEIDILLLDIAGVAANIGANILNTKALEFKQSLYENSPAQNSAMSERFILHLNTLLQEIIEYK